MIIDNIHFKPIGYELGYCLGVQGNTGQMSIYYFHGYPELPYEKCEILPLPDADVKTFVSETMMGEGRDKNHKYFRGRIVRKGLGRILSHNWSFIPNQGIQCDDVDIFFGMRRSDVRAKLDNEQEFNFSLSEKC